MIPDNDNQSPEPGNAGVPDLVGVGTVEEVEVVEGGGDLDIDVDIPMTENTNVINPSSVFQNNVNGNGNGNGANNDAMADDLAIFGRAFGFGGGGRPGSGGSGAGGGGDNDPYSKITMDDVGGLDVQKDWLKNAVLKKPLKNKSEESQWGLQPPKGILFFGPPGTGKTLLARAFGNDLSTQLGRRVRFFHRKGGDLLDPWFGGSKEKIRKLFQDAITNKPAIIFFDELDGLSPNRDGQSCQAYVSVVTSLLGEMDALPTGEVFVFGATNRLDDIDPAMRRPGRFDKHLEFLPPTPLERETIITIYTNKWARSHPDGEMLQNLASHTSGYTGADLENLCRHAFFEAFHRINPTADLDVGIEDLEVTMEDWTNALSQTRPSPSSVFGSSLYTPAPPNDGVKGLITTPAKLLAGKILEEMNAMIDGSGSWGSGGTSTNLGITAVIIKDARRDGNDRFLEDTFIPTVFTSKELATFPIYRLTKEQLKCQHQNVHSLSIARTFHQAVSCLKPCFLYIPRIDSIVIDLPGILQDQLEKIRGKQVLLLSTAAEDALQYAKQDPDMTTTLTAFKEFTVNMDIPSKKELEERRYYFESALQPILSATRKLSKSSQDRIIKNATDVTEGKPYESIVKLHDMMVAVGRRTNLTQDQKVRVVEEIIVNYNLKDGDI